MAKTLIPCAFSSVAELAKTHRVLLPKPYEWRLLNPSLQGEVQGIPNCRGTAVASNGILVLVLQDKSFFFGHIDWFVTDNDEDLTVKKVLAGKTAKPTKKENVDILEFV